MKPALKDIKDNYERVLLRLHSGELAGIVGNNTLNLQVLRKTHWIDKAITTADLDKSYNGTNSVTDFNIDAIAFLRNKSLVNDVILYGRDEIIDWDWDINNPHNLKFKKGDKVRVLDSEKRPRYEQITNKIGKIVYISSYIDPYRHIENTNYYVEIPEYANEYQSKGWWVFKNANSLRLMSDEVTYDDQMDEYNYSMLGIRYHIDDIIKGDNKTMNNILDIYGDRKREKINKHYEQLMEQTKLADERYVIFKDCSNKLDKLYKEDGIITNHLVEPRLAEKTKKHLEELAELREEEYCKLDNKIKEVVAQLSMCETYDQKQEILRRYNIINKNGKVNG